MPAYPHGIDISSYQADVDWSQVAASGRTFAFIKATGGSWYRNPYLESQTAGARAAGLQLGWYAYAFETSGDLFPGAGPEAEADYFCDTIIPFGFQAGDLLALDVEDPGAYGDLGEWCLRWLRRVEDRCGWKPLIYTGSSYIAEHGLARPDLAEYGLWLAAYQASPPATPYPWPVIAFWQFTANGRVPGVTGDCDLNVFNGSHEAILLYGKPDGEAPPELLPPQPLPPPSDLPVYDWQEPSRLQETDADCAVESIEWCMFSWGRAPDDDWLEQSMYAAGVWNPAVGCTDATGQGLASWVNAEYGEFGYVASAQPTDFNTLADEAATHKHPIAAGGAEFYHWVGVRSYDPQTDTLILANPAPGWMQVGDVLPRWRFEELGPWHLVRVTHPAAEADTPPDPPNPTPEPEPEPPPSLWTDTVGSGLLELLAQDGAEPAQSASMWIGGPPAEIEQIYGTNGILYVWLMSEGRGVRIKPS
jgi:GH25 family lysozyme M1 (1,4-beta-N-acetylmuramidase)